MNLRTLDFCIFVACIVIFTLAFDALVERVRQHTRRDWDVVKDLNASVTVLESRGYSNVVVTEHSVKAFKGNNCYTWTPLKGGGK